jgi:lipoyl-dependent peroxiredoxin
LASVLVGRGPIRCGPEALVCPEPVARERPADSVATAVVREETEMAKSLYTAQAHVVGGRDQGHGVTSDGALDVQLRTPVEMGGGGGGTNPEQLFAVGYAACFEGALGVVGRREHVELGAVAIDSEVSLITTENRGFTVAVGLDVSLPGIDDPERAVSIVAAAHEVCPYSNATRGNVEVTLKANGHLVPTAGPGQN